MRVAHARLAEPIAGTFAGEVRGVTLGRDTDPGTAEALRRALLQHPVLCVRDQHLDPAAFAAACRVFGEPILQTRRQIRVPEAPEVSVMSNQAADIHGDGRPFVIGTYWHSDNSFKPVPCSVTLLHAVDLPSRGGDTWFADLRAAYQALDEGTRDRIQGLRCIHAYDSPRAKGKVAARSVEELAETPDVEHPLVRTHPETGQRALYLNPNRIKAIVGLPAAESEALLDTLIAHASQPRFLYRHGWRAGDLLMWDNRCTMHRVDDDLPAGAVRTMLRVILAGTVPA